MSDATTNSNYYYEQPFEEATTTTTTTSKVSSNPSANRKKLTIILLAIIAVFILIALIALIFNKPSVNNTSNTITSENVTLQFRGAFLEPAVMQPILDDYTKLHPNIKIDYANKWPSGAKYADAEAQYRSTLNGLLKQADPVQVPDIFMVNNSWVGDYDSSTYTKASNTYDYGSFKDTFYPVVSDDFAHDNVVHGVPLWMDTMAILYNKDLLAEKNTQVPPTSWKDFKDLALNLTKKENGNIKQGGFAAGVVSNTTYPFQLFNVLLFQDGVEMLNDKSQPSFATFATATDALKFYQGFSKGDKTTWDSSLKIDSAAFLEGRAAMIMATSYRYRDIKSANEKFNLKVNIGISQLPQSSGQSQPVINWADYWGAMVSSVRPNSAVAWDLLKWMSQPEQLKKLSTSYTTNNKTFGLLYPRKDMQQILQSDADLSIFNASLPFAKSWYMVKGIEVKGVFNTLLTTGTIDPSALSKAQSDVLTLISNKGKI